MSYIPADYGGTILRPSGRVVQGRGSKGSKVEAEADSPETLRNGGRFTPVASSKIEPGLAQARGKSDTSLHLLLISLLASDCSEQGY
jgi:hypothetical protein